MIKKGKVSQNPTGTQRALATKGICYGSAVLFIADASMAAPVA